MHASKLRTVLFPLGTAILLLATGHCLADEESSTARLAQNDNAKSDRELAPFFVLVSDEPSTNASSDPDDTDLDDVSRIGIVDDQSEVVLAQATAATTNPPTNSSAFTASPTGGTGLGWLNNVIVSGSQTSVKVQDPDAGSNPATNAAFVEVKTDAASMLDRVPGVSIGRRAIGVSDPILQGRRLGQVPARGSYWFPARQDLDTLLSKIDSRLVSDIVAINGPYSALYGPGLSFYDVELLRAPRFKGGYDSFGSTSVDYKTNGDQWYGRQSFHGGSEDWGFRIGYGHRAGSDYESGDGSLFSSSYNSGMFDAALGADLTCDSHIDIHVLRLDQTDVEYPGQFFDMNFLVTDAYEVVYALEDQPLFDRLTLETWYNRTRFAGDNLRPGKRRQLPSLDNPFVMASSTTDVDAMSTGYRVALSWEETCIGDVKTGTDFRYLKQRLNEFNETLFIPADLNFPIPPSHSSNPGLFLESTAEVSDRMRIKMGTRVDWVSTNADDLVDGNPQPVSVGLGSQLDQHFRLWSAFLTAEYDVAPHWVLDGGFGHAMRPPTMTELYAVGPFIAAFPQKIQTSLFGNPLLRPERMWQIDLGLTGNYECFSGGIHGFYSWINDYITFDQLAGIGLPQYGHVNTDLATLSGFELFGDYRVNRCLSAFSTLSYVEGRDHDRNGSISQLRSPGDQRSNSTAAKEPLPVMSPLEARIGMSLHEPIENPRWSIEFTARIVDAQDRIAASLLEEETPGYTIFDVRAYALLLDNLLVTAGVENLTDKHYQTYYDTRGEFGDRDLFRPGINFYFGTQWSY